MFATNKIFRLPWDFEEDSAEWRAIELSLNLPWYLIEVENCEEKIPRTFFFSSLRDITPFFEESSTGMTCISMNLALPPDMSNTGNWLFVPIQQVGRELPKDDGSKSQLVLMGKNGVFYGENPLEPVKKDVGNLVPLLEFK